MASSISRVLSTLAVVVAVPAACVGSLLAYGRALSEAQPAEGTLVGPEEQRRRVEEAARRFAAMSPAEHLAAARVALSVNYHPDVRTGGLLGVASHHLDAIPATAPEAAEVSALRVEIAARPRRVLVAAAALIRDAPAGADETSRERLTRALDGLSPAGLGCVHHEGPAATVLRFDNGRCDAEMLDAAIGQGGREKLRAMGFTRVRCHGGAAEIVP